MFFPDMEGKLALHLALHSQQLCVLKKPQYSSGMLGTGKHMGTMAQPVVGGLPPWKQLTLVSGMGIWPEAEKAASESTHCTINKNFRVMKVKQIHSKTNQTQRETHSAQLQKHFPQCPGCTKWQHLLENMEE